MKAWLLALATAGCHDASGKTTDAAVTYDLASRCGANDVLVGNADQTATPLAGASALGAVTAFHFVAGAGGVVCRVRVYLVHNAAYRVHVGLYDGAAQPDRMLTSADLSVGASTAGYWVTGVVAPATVQAGADYWLAVTSTEGGAVGFAHGSGSPSTQIAAGDLPSAWPTGAQKMAADAPILGYAGP